MSNSKTLQLYFYKDEILLIFTNIIVLNSEIQKQ